MFCPECGKKVEKGTTFCAECGARIEKTKIGVSTSPSLGKFDKQTLPVSFSLTYRNLRALFFAGFALTAVLTFVPALKAEVGGFMGMGGEERSLSALDLIRLLFQGGQAGLGILFVLMFCTTVAFAVLAIKYPRRWVFIAGSCYAVFGILLAFFSGSNKDIQYYFLPRLLGYIATAMTLTGFWVRPPIHPATPQPTPQSLQT